MTFEEKGNLRFRARATTALATIALVVSGYLVMSGTTADPAAGASVNKALRADKLTEEASAGTSQFGPADDAFRGDMLIKVPQAGSSQANLVERILRGDVPIQVWPAGAPPEDDDPERAAANDLFRSDPQYEDKYNAEGQVDIYGGKRAVEPPRPPLELGRQQYTSGAYDESNTFFGQKNGLLPGLAVYGDWRTAIAYNDNAGNDIAQVATRVNVDIDLKLTGTERIHAFFTPLQDDAQFTRYEFGGAGADKEFNFEFDPDPQTLFFEGDFGSIISGFRDDYTSFDLPFTVGLFPLFLQTGNWAKSPLLGGAITLPGTNSALINLSNFDSTFFAAVDDIGNTSVLNFDGQVDNNEAYVYGVTAFIDAFAGYIETGYGLLQGVDDQDGLLIHFATAAYTRRWSDTISNSTRVFANFGDENGNDIEGFAVISENSLVTSLPSTLIPYANFFVGFGAPRPLVSADGLLKNVGINFEPDALTGFPALDDTGSNTFGGALGLQYLFNLDQQIVLELAMVQPFGDPEVGAEDPQYAVGFRYQLPITRAWLIRADATYQILENSEDSAGARFEVRRKF